MSLKPRTIKGGLLVIFEGIDGVGKSTQLELAYKQLQADGWPVYLTRNLGGTPIGEELRKVILGPIPRPPTTNLHISLAISEAIIEQLEIQRAKNQIILMDRGPLSLAAYEIYGSQLNKAQYMPYVDAAMASLRPEVTILYKTDVVTALQRAKSKQNRPDYFESKSLDYFERVAAGYDAVAKHYLPNVTVIDASQSIEQVQNLTIQAIDSARQASATH